MYVGMFTHRPKGVCMHTLCIRALVRVRNEGKRLMVGARCKYYMYAHIQVHECAHVCMLNNIA
jgi:hypothetical protein